MQTPPTPWTIGDELRADPLFPRPSTLLLDATGMPTARVYGDIPEQARATAALILAAVNGREQMREALAAVESDPTAPLYAWANAKEISSDEYDRRSAVILQVRAAIRKAEGG